MPLRADHFAFQELGQIPVVVNLRQPVEDREPVNLLVVFRFNVAAGQIAVKAVPDAQVVAVLEKPRVVELFVVDERAVGAVLVADVVPFLSWLNQRVPTGDGVVVQADVALLATANHQRSVRKRVPAAHCGAAWVNMDEARFPSGSEQPLGRRDPSIGDLFCHRVAQGTSEAKDVGSFTRYQNLGHEHAAGQAPKLAFDGNPKVEIAPGFSTARTGLWPW